MIREFLYGNHALSFSGIGSPLPIPQWLRPQKCTLARNKEQKKLTKENNNKEMKGTSTHDIYIQSIVLENQRRMQRAWSNWIPRAMQKKHGMKVSDITGRPGLCNLFLKVTPIKRLSFDLIEKNLKENMNKHIQRRIQFRETEVIER